MISCPILSFMIFMPLICAGFMIVAKQNESYPAENVRNIALLSNVLLVLANFILFLSFDENIIDLQFGEKSFNGWFLLGIDGVDLIMLSLTSIVFATAFALSWNNKDLQKKYFICLMIVQSIINAAVLSVDMIQFYIFFEIAIFSMLWLLMLGDEKNKIYATLKFLSYQIIGFLLMLGALGYFYYQKLLINENSIQNLQIIWAMLMIGLFIKIGFFPFHRWGSLIHSVVANPISVIFLGVGANLCIYAMLKLPIALMPEISYEFNSYVYVLVLIAMLYVGLLAVVESNFKKIIAYNSIIISGIAVLGLFSWSEIGLLGMVFAMVGQTVISISLCLCAEVLKNKNISYNIKKISGIRALMPLLTTFFVVVMSSIIGLPVTVGFFPKWFALAGVLEESKFVVFLALIVLLVPVIYIVNLYKKIFMGEPKFIPENITITRYEKLLMGVYLFLIVGLGICPWVISEVLQNSFFWLEK